MKHPPKRLRRSPLPLREGGRTQRPGKASAAGALSFGRVAQGLSTLQEDPGA